uniref:Uncharacterized protein n=1 Tax=Pelagomonas calceolata TaxID=35677 RepID=A0A7S4EC55_9STRA|mmetsp:Transcript_24196/g.67900  ORF Transcript_24196/g.67900 Transcript_24196/m.67900 type:complete len:144 (+) Transcript_24196:241-672(+)
MLRPSLRLLVFALAVVAHGGPALNLDDWSYDALPWRAWSNDQAHINVESFYVTGANRELFVKGQLDAAVGASYGVVGLERTLDDVDLSPYAAIEVNYDSLDGEIPLAMELRLQSPAGDYRGPGPGHGRRRGCSPGRRRERWRR